MRKRRITFHGYFSLLLSLTILTAAIIWIIYGELPSQYYLPLSLGLVVVVGFLAYFILDKKVEF